MHFKFLIAHSICLSASWETEEKGKEKNPLLKLKNIHVYHSYLLGDQVWKVFMLKNFLPNFYEQVKRGYEIEL